MEGTVAKLVLHIDPDPAGEQELDHVDLTNESSVSGPADQSEGSITWPKWAATWSGVYPALVSASHSAPLSTSSRATPTLSSWAHRWIGVSPFLALAFTSDPWE